MLKYLFIFSSLCSSFRASAQDTYEMKQGIIRFYSEAPQELISASTTQLRGVLDIKKKQFVFKVPNVSFMGFNSPLQREHFNENYIETDIYPESGFRGKIIEDVDVSKDGVYKVRAKGKLIIHGVEQERIIDVDIKTKDGKLSVRSEFLVALGEHNIKIPRVVYDKLAPDIHIAVSGSMTPVRPK